MTILTSCDVSIRLLQNTMQDKELLFHWLSNPIVHEIAWREGVPWTMEKIEKCFTGKLNNGENISPCIILYHQLPVGYVQFYPACKEEYKFIEPVHLEDFDNGHAIDIFIGLPELWGKGIGSKTISALKQYLFHELKSTIIFADPDETNYRSIRCWEKAGFKAVGKIQNYDEPDKVSICMMAKNQYQR